MPVVQNAVQLNLSTSYLNEDQLRHVSLYYLKMLYLSAYVSFSLSMYLYIYCIYIYVLFFFVFLSLSLFMYLSISRKCLRGPHWNSSNYIL